MTSDKLTFKEICNKKNIPNPDLFDFNKINKLYIEKDRTGCGSANVRIVKDNKSYKKIELLKNIYQV